MELYNSLTRHKEVFKPLKKKTVTLYVCGITPYDTTHLGHAFTYVSFDVLVRFLIYKGYTVCYTQNVTDIDDDILKKARTEKKDWRKLGDFWTQKFLKDLNLLHVLPPTNYVKATNSIPKMIEMIQLLLKKGHAYSVDGTIYFDVTTFKDYGKLSKFTKKQMLFLAKERGGNPDNPKQKNPLDFILWQKSEKNEPYWDSPFGKGRPGWHIECSTMVHEFLGPQIDIHGGGRDLIFPHHESEIAQSESYTGKLPYVSYWMHTAMVQYQGEKMAKSLGNLVMVSDLLKNYSANAVRFLLLSNHYRSPWEFEEKKLKTAQAEVDLLLTTLGKEYEEKGKEDSKLLKEFCKYLDDDLNTPHALLVIKKIATLTRKEKDNKRREQLLQTLFTTLKILGFSY